MVHKHMLPTCEGLFYVVYVVDVVDCCFFWVWRLEEVIKKVEEFALCRYIEIWIYRSVRITIHVYNTFFMG